MYNVQSSLRKIVQEGINTALLLVPARNYIATLSQWRLADWIYDKFSSLVSFPLDPRLLMLSMASLTLGGWPAPGASMAGILAAYVFWNWRSLTVLMVFFCVELDRMKLVFKGQSNPPMLAFGANEPVAYLAQEQRSSMLRFLSHDLRAPQSAILALLEMQQKAKEPMPVGELRRHIEQQVRRMLSLTDGLLALDEAKSKPLVFEPVFVAAVALDAIDQAWLLAQYKGIRIRHRFIDDEICVTNASRELLTRAVFNLLENAVKYSARDTTIDIELVLQETEIVLTIRDEGQGIAESDLPHLFEEFSQFGDDHTPRKGYGLGLAFVNSVLQRHKARIECTSQINIGTTFALTFKAIN